MSSAPLPSQQPQSPPRLQVFRVLPNHPIFRAIQGWNYPSEPFYVNQVRRMLLTDVPQSIIYGGCQFFAYRDLNSPGLNIVGFGTIEVCGVYSHLCGNVRHCYIPVLGVRPNTPPSGYGTAIVTHLIEFARRNILRHHLPQNMHARNISDSIFLDVYEKNEPAMKLYRNKFSFEVLNPHNPIEDPEENSEKYFIMGRKITLPSSQAATP